jgi:hypothetical protein
MLKKVQPEYQRKSEMYRGIEALVVGVGLVFSMLRTYTCSKSGLSARKPESNTRDATISLWMVNEDSS